MRLAHVYPNTLRIGEKRFDCETAAVASGTTLSCMKGDWLTVVVSGGREVDIGTVGTITGRKEREESPPSPSYYDFFAGRKSKKGKEWRGRGGLDNA